jgi:glycosyltransferase involved in cell wall biosynthesis
MMSATDNTNGDRPVRTPMVSVIIPVYNTAAFIAETLQSVFVQTFRDSEVIVVNDGSPDSEDLERVIAPYRTRILYLRQDNRGPAAARNAGIRQARGKYLAFLDSDDCWLPGYLASQMKLLEENPSVVLVYSDALHFGDPATAGKTYMQTCPSNGAITLEALIKEDCQVITSCTIALKQAVLDAGLFDERLDIRGCEDFDLWLRILYRGQQAVYQREVLGRHRSHPGGLSQDTAKMLEHLVVVYEKAATTMLLRKETRTILQKQIARAQAQFHLESGKKFLTLGDFDRATDSLTKANHFFHRAKLRVAILGLQFSPRLFRSAAITWQRLVSKLGFAGSIQSLWPG